MIDFHTHCFPDSLAPRVIEKLSFTSGGLLPYSDGTADGLRREMQHYGVDRSVVLGIATNAAQQRNVNNFIASINDGTLIGFGSVYPHAEDALEELERIKALGLKGVKLHAEYQQFCADDPKMKPIYKKISQLGLITVFHTGYDYGYAPPYGAMPDQLRRALAWFDSPVVAAHWGASRASDEVLRHLCDTDAYFDTSFGYGQMPREHALQILERHGVARMLFASDMPWHNPEMELRLLRTLGLSDAEMHQITDGNAEKLLGLSTN